MRAAPSAPPVPATPPSLSRPAIGLGFAAMFVVMGVRTAFAVLYPAMVPDLGWSVAQITGAFSAGLLVYAPTAVAVGVLVDRAGCRATMLGGCAFLVVGMTLVALASELWHFYLAFILAIGFGSSAVGFIAVVKLLSLRAPRRFAAAFGLATMGQGVGALLISPAVQGVVEVAGWRAGALAVAGLVAFGLLPLVALLAPGRQSAGERRPAASTPPAGLLSWVFAAFFLSNIMLGYQMLIPTHQVAHLLGAGFASMTAAMTAGLWGVLTALGGAAGGWALERWGNARLLALATALFGLGTGALIASTPEAVWLAALFVLASGAGRGVLGVGLGTAQTRAFAGPRLGQFTGLLDLGFGIGAFLGPWLTAVAYDATGSFGAGLASAIAAAAMVAAATVLGSRLASARRSDEFPVP